MFISCAGSVSQQALKSAQAVPDPLAPAAPALPPARHALTCSKQFAATHVWIAELSQAAICDAHFAWAQVAAAGQKADNAGGIIPVHPPAPVPPVLVVPPLVAPAPPDDEPPLVAELPATLEAPPELVPACELAPPGLVPAPLPAPSLLLAPLHASAAEATTSAAMPDFIQFMTCPLVEPGTSRNCCKLSVWVHGHHGHGRRIPKRRGRHRIRERPHQDERVVRAIFETGQATARQDIRPTLSE